MANLVIWQLCPPKKQTDEQQPSLNICKVTNGNRDKEEEKGTAVMRLNCSVCECVCSFGGP